MRGTVAKRLRREAQMIGQFYAPDDRYFLLHKGVQHAVKFGRKLLKLIENDDGKVETESFTMVPEEWGTVKHQQLGVHGVYQQLKREYYEKKHRVGLRVRAGDYPISARRKTSRN